MGRVCVCVCVCKTIIYNNIRQLFVSLLIDWFVVTVGHVYWWESTPVRLVSVSRNPVTVGDRAADVEDLTLTYFTMVEGKNVYGSNG